MHIADERIVTVYFRTAPPRSYSIRRIFLILYGSFQSMGKTLELRLFAVDVSRGKISEDRRRKKEESRKKQEGDHCIFFGLFRLAIIRRIAYFGSSMRRSKRRREHWAFGLASRTKNR